MRAPLLCRDDELRIVDDVLFGRLNGAAFTGEPGLGRSALLDAAEHRADEIGVTVFRVYGTPASSSFEFGAAATLIADTTRVDRLSVLRDTERSLLDQTGQRGGVLLVDDGHDLDAATMTLLHTIAASRRLRILLTASTDARIPPTLTRLWKDNLVSRVELVPFDRPMSRRLLEQFVGGDVTDDTERTVWDLTVGHPLYIRAIADHCSFETSNGTARLTMDPLDSGGLRDIVAPRLDGLTNEMLDALACLDFGSPLDVSIIDAAAGHDAAVAIERSGLVVADHGALRPRHPLLARVAGATGPAGRRRDIGAAMATVLLDRDRPSPENVVRAANVLLDTDTDTDEHIGTLLDAPAHALAIGDFASAERIAGAVLGRVAPDDRWRTALVLAKARRQLGDTRGAEEAFEVAATATQVADRVDVAVARAESLAIAGGRVEAGLAVLAEMSNSTSDPVLRRRLAIERTFLSSLIGDFREVAAVAEPLLDDAGLDDLTLLFAGTGLVFARAMLLRTDSHDELLDRLRTIATRIATDHPLALDQLDLIDVVALVIRGRIDEAVAACVDRRARGMDHTWGCGDGSWAAIETFARSFQTEPGLVDVARRAVAALDDTDPMGLRQVGTGLCVVALQQCGADEEADELLARAAAPLSEGERRTADLIAARTSAWTAARAGDDERAAALVTEAGRQALRWGHVLWGVLGLYDAVRFGHAADVADDLRRAAAESAANASLLHAICRHADAEVAGHPEDLAAVSLAFASMGATVFAADASCDAAAAFEARGDAAEAQRCIARAQLLTGGRLPPTPRRRPVTPAMTDRQAEVVLMALDGLTARETAERLTVSTRTVENHMAAVYRNLGISSRTQLLEVLRPTPPSGSVRP